jgi:hypothetical protein
MRVMKYLLALSTVLITSETVATTLTATADTYVDQALPTSNYGSSGIVAVSGTRTALIRFDPALVASSHGNVAVLSLRIIAAKNFTDGISIRLVQGPWSEKTVTARTAPVLSTTALDSFVVSHSDQGATVQLDLSSALPAWRHSPSTNYGIAITASAPAPNLQLGARELKTAATLDIGSSAILQVTHIHDGFAQAANSINNPGEIVYEEFTYVVPSRDTGRLRIYSTRRGLIVPAGTENRSAADINDAGEVVWSDGIWGPPPGPTIHSSTRGTVGIGGNPRISQDGRVAAELVDSNQLGIYATEGSLTQVALDPNVAPFSKLTCLNLSTAIGVAYEARTVNTFNDNLFFSHGGQITHFTPPVTPEPFLGANDLGDWAYTKQINDQGIQQLFNSANEVIWNNAAGRPDINDQGDIVFTEPVTVNKQSASQVLLSTRRPFEFLRKDKLQYRGVSLN